MLQSDSLFIRTRTKRRLSRYYPYKKYVVIVVCLALVLVFLVGLLPRILSSTKRILEGPKLVFSFITNVGPQLEQERGRTNILLLGKGGGTHPGANLTDSNIFMSVDNSTGDTVMISLPRDIWVEELEQPEDNKLNRMYEIGEEKKKGGGLLLSKAIVSHLIGQPVHYAVLIDFEGFKKAIDILGGIDIEVERSFIDSFYPIPGKEEAPYEERFEVIRFEKGLQHMDGTTALKFIRSR
ncbi:MAG TPA: LCP family protein, partial [Patescibacteria group bacterium]|nr:LCP family protein [Patescibacteria group bacterium]